MHKQPLQHFVSSSRSHKGMAVLQYDTSYKELEVGSMPQILISYVEEKKSLLAEKDNLYC